MKRNIIILLLFLAMSFSSCGPSQEEYDDLLNEKEKLESRVEELEIENESLQEKIDELESEIEDLEYDLQDCQNSVSQSFW